MAERNRVDPYGEIITTELRGCWMGNRGNLHRDHAIVRPWNGKRWITCVLEYKGWIAPQWKPGRWTALFFYDEALAFAAGHRPCALCRREDYRRYQVAVDMNGADAIDAQLHGERLDGRIKRTHAVAWRGLPSGTFVELLGVPHLVLTDRIRPWDIRHGYGAPSSRPEHGDARVLTPPLSLRAFAAGYAPQIRI
ncbi:MAG: hypothetical protein M3N13_07275 [Candidatus Eremiobacteraeota bacterium]|nr:hypothetical protein [Candidatus Eremiobacteraeota bacterium]